MKLLNIEPGAILVQILREWAPFSEESRARRQSKKRARRIRKGKCVCDESENLVDDYCPLHGTKKLVQQKEDTMLQGKLTHTGAGVAASSPIVGLVVTAFVPHIEAKIVELGIAPVMCAVEATNCITAGQLAFGLVSGVFALIGGAVASFGRKRAERRHAADLAAAEAAKQGS